MADVVSEDDETVRLSHVSGVAGKSANSSFAEPGAAAIAGKNGTIHP